MISYGPWKAVGAEKEEAKQEAEEEDEKRRRLSIALQLRFHNVIERKSSIS